MDSKFLAESAIDYRIAKFESQGTFGQKAIELAWSDGVRWAWNGFRQPLPSAAAKPEFAYTIDYTGCYHTGFDIARVEKIAEEGSKGPTKVVYLWPGPKELPNYDTQENICFLAAMNQWERSKKRDDMIERDRVVGAIKAYMRQAFAFKLLADIDIDGDSNAAEL